MAEYKAGDKLRRYGDSSGKFTEGHSYTVAYVGFNCVRVVDDNGADHRLSFDYIPKHFELVTEPQPDVHALIANIGRRLHEVEVAITPREYDEVGPAEPQPDAVNPDHYKRGKYETIDIIEHITAGYDDGFVAHCAGTAIKYITRAPFKHATPTEDLRKAARYLEFAIKHLEAEAAE